MSRLALVVGMAVFTNMIMLPGVSLAQTPRGTVPTECTECHNGVGEQKGWFAPSSRLGDSVLCVNHRVHRHAVGDLHGELLCEIFSGEHRLEHDRKSRHRLGDHSACEHD